MVAPLALNVAEAEPAGTTTEDGTVKFVLLLVTLSDKPPAGAGPLRLTVQLEVPGTESEAGLHPNELRRDGADVTVTAPALPVTDKAPPAGEAAIGLDKPIVIDPDDTDGVTETVATTPSAMAPVFKPLAMHW